MKRGLQGFFLMAMLCLSLMVVAQRTMVQGKVTDTTGEPLIGAAVSVKGTSRGATTDANGAFSLEAGTNQILHISYIGYKTREIAARPGTVMTIVLDEDNANLNEVVVTALGIKKERKALGYSVQEVAGQAIADQREPNVVNALSGKIAGLQVVRGSNGPAGSSKIILRGNNSLTGNNQPLIVVDGVPMNNFTGAANNDYWNPSLDMGNGMADINADDIENISVLKGPSAAALYGSRAGNGVILITTKSGKSQKGVGLTVNYTLGTESMFMMPQFQNNFGQGADGVFDARSSSSWGPKITGQQVTNWNKQPESLAAYDNLRNFIGSGTSHNVGAAFQQDFGKSSLYTSFNQLNDQSMIPGVKLSRTNITARSVARYGAAGRLSTDTKIQFIRSDATNRPIGGPRTDNAFYSLYLLPRSLDVTAFSEGVNADRNMIWYDGGQQINPYWGYRNIYNNDKRDRFLMTGAIKYQFTPWLDAELKAGGDLYTTDNESKVYAGSPLARAGRFGVGKDQFMETNVQLLFTAKKARITDKIGGFLTFGGNLMDQKSSSVTGAAGELVVPNLFSVNNSVGNPSVGYGLSRRKINSIFGSVQVNYDDYLFLDATLRNDWSSTLSAANRSYFYPSVSASYVVSEMLQKKGVSLPKWWTMAKLRGSFAEVGNDLPPYQLYNTFNIGKDPNGNTTASRGGILFDESVRSELIKSLEIGAELRFLANRLGLDVAYYKSNATRQLLNLPMDPTSGFSARKINAGNIENSGVEIALDGRIIQARNGFNWNVNANYAANRNYVRALAPGVTRYGLGGFDDLQVLAVEGEKYGEIYGSTYKRVTDATSPYFGKIIVDGNGLPLKETSPQRLGNQQALGLLGLTNTFSYKGLTLSMLIDARFGGMMFSGTSRAMQIAGTAAATAPGGDRADFVVDGVVASADGKTYTPNAKPVKVQQYWNAVAGNGNLGINEANLYDASSTRIRNIQLSYDIPRSVLGKVVQRARVGISANNVLLLSGGFNGIDPESVFATGTNATGFENASSPTSRAILFKLMLGF